MQFEVNVTSIDWDCEGAEGLPASIQSLHISADDHEDLDERITDALSDRYGFCINTLTYEVNDLAS